jgi:hypothetical protein
MAWLLKQTFRIAFPFYGEKNSQLIAITGDLRTKMYGSKLEEGAVSFSVYARRTLEESRIF